MDLAGVLGVLVISLLTGGPNDLLDYVPTQDYWKAKGVEVGAQTIEAELAMPAPVDVGASIRDLGSNDFQTREHAQRAIEAAGVGAVPQLNAALKSPDREVVTRATAILAQLGWSGQTRQVRVLMAVRTLGEIKDQDALATLHPLLESKEPFVADYAAAAIAAIEGKTYLRPRATAEQRRADVALLPAAVDAVAQFHVVGGPVLSSIARDMEYITEVQGRGEKVPAATFTKCLIQAVEQVGNVRLDSLTVGMGDHRQVLIYRAIYDRQAVADMIRKGHVDAKVRDENGVSIIDYDLGEATQERQTTLLLPSELIYVYGFGDAKQAAAQVLTALQRGRGSLDHNVAMSKVLQTVDPTGPLWLAMTIGKPSRHAPILDPFDALTLATQIKSQPRSLEFKFRVTGGDKTQRTALVEHLRSEFRDDIGMYQRERGTPDEADLIAGFVDLLKSIAVTTEGDLATMTGSVSDSSAMGALLSECLYMMAVIIEAPRVPHAAAAQVSPTATPPVITTQPAR